MENIIIILIVAVIVISIAVYLIKARKRGQKCVGCPYCKECSGNCDSKNSE